MCVAVFEMKGPFAHQNIVRQYGCRNPGNCVGGTTAIRQELCGKFGGLFDDVENQKENKSITACACYIILKTFWKRNAQLVLLKAG